jgi:hypothetical protein
MRWVSVRIRGIGDPSKLMFTRRQDSPECEKQKTPESCQAELPRISLFFGVTTQMLSLRTSKAVKA